MVKVLEDNAGAEDACVFVGGIASQVGADLEKKYIEALGVRTLSRAQLIAILIDVQNRISGDFYLIEESEERIVLGNRICPLGETVRTHPALCMMTSHISGRLTANALGYAAVDLEQTIARGDLGCRIVIYLKPTKLPPASREYFRGDAVAPL
jgi:predicted ArsR family transcriptional regulator